MCVDGLVGRRKEVRPAAKLEGRWLRGGFTSSRAEGLCVMSAAAV